MTQTNVMNVKCGNEECNKSNDDSIEEISHQKISHQTSLLQAERAPYPSGGAALG
jgi:hypothetical protein